MKKSSMEEGKGIEGSSKEVCLLISSWENLKPLFKKKISAHAHLAHDLCRRTCTIESPR